MQGIGDRALMDMPQRRDIGIVARGNGNRVPDGEVVELPLRTQIALRLLRLAQPRQLQMERMTVIPDQLMPGDERAHAPADRSLDRLARIRSTTPTARLCPDAGAPAPSAGSPAG